MGAFWAHRKNQKILNDYITGIILRRWDLIQSEKKRNVSTNGHTGISNGHANGTGGAKIAKSNGNGHAGEFQERRRDILDKVLAALEPGEWGPAVVRQVGNVCASSPLMDRSIRWKSPTSYVVESCLMLVVSCQLVGQSGYWGKTGCHVSNLLMGAAPLGIVRL